MFFYSLHHLPATGGLAASSKTQGACRNWANNQKKKTPHEDLAYPLLTCDWWDANVGFVPSSLKWCYFSFKRFTSSFNTELLFARRIPHSLSENLAIPLAAGPHTDTHMHTQHRHKCCGRNEPCCPPPKAWVCVCGGCLCNSITLFWLVLGTTPVP